MKILAVDSSGLVASVALLDDNKVMAEYNVNNKITHSQTLVPMLEEITNMLGLELKEIDAIAVAKGPGSFTGLRIGSATVKGLGLALNKPIIPVPTVDGLAMNGWGYKGIVCPIMDARRSQVYTGIYRFTDGCLEVIDEQMAISVEDLCTRLNEFECSVLMLGDGVPVYKEMLDEKLTVAHEYAPSHMAAQRAAALGVLAVDYYRNGIFESADDHKPEYLRMSQAEREKSEREGQKTC